MDNPRISVVIPVFNGERYLEQAIASALGQSYAPHQVIVVDDGSTDSSREIAKSFGASIVHLVQANQGPSAARNFGVDRSTGEWVAFLDADDYWCDDKLELQAAVIRNDPGVDLVYTGWSLIGADGVRSIKARPPDWVKRRLPYQCPLIPSTVLVRRSLLQSYPWSTDFRSSEDWWLFYRLSRHARFSAIEASTSFYRQHDESLTQRDWRPVLKYASLVAARIQQDFTGIGRLRLKRMVDGRLLASAAVAAREQGSRESLRLVIRSLIAWPFPNIRPPRYKALPRMLVQCLSRQAAPAA